VTPTPSMKETIEAACVLGGCGTIGISLAPPLAYSLLWAIATSCVQLIQLFVPILFDSGQEAAIMPKLHSLAKAY